MTKYSESLHETVVGLWDGRELGFDIQDEWAKRTTGKLSSVAISPPIIIRNSPDSHVLLGLRGWQNANLCTLMAEATWIFIVSISLEVHGKMAHTLCADTFATTDIVTIPDIHQAMQFMYARILESACLLAEQHYPHHKKK